MPVITTPLPVVPISYLPTSAFLFSSFPPSPVEPRPDTAAGGRGKRVAAVTASGHRRAASPSGMGGCLPPLLPLPPPRPEQPRRNGPRWGAAAQRGSTVLRLSEPGQPGWPPGTRVSDCYRSVPASRVACRVLLAWKGTGSATESQRIWKGQGGDVRVFPLPGTHTVSGTRRGSPPSPGRQPWETNQFILVPGTPTSSSWSLGQAREGME